MSMNRTSQEKNKSEQSVTSTTESKEEIVFNDGRNARSHSTNMALIEAAQSEFLSQGYRDTTIGGITKLAGVAHGTFYNHYESKEAILIRVMEGVLQKIFDILELIPYEPSCTKEAIVILKRNQITIFNTALEYQDLLRVFRDAMGESPDIRRYWDEKVIAHLISLTVQDYRYSKKKGLARSKDELIVAKAIVAMIEHFYWRLVLDLESANDIERIADTITEIYIRGVYLEPEIQQGKER